MALLCGHAPVECSRDRLERTPIMNTLSAACTQTPDGIFTILASDSAVLASGWTDDPHQLVELIHPELRLPLQQASGGGPAVLQDALAAVQDYYDGDYLAVAAIPVLQRSGPFRQSAWEALRQVQPGRPLTYTDYAARAGNAGAVRAAAGACAMNAAALFIPCHRVVRADGSLGGFRYGDRKSTRL